MSHSGAKIVIDTVVFYGEYNGTSDILRSQFYKTPQEREEYWRKDNPKTIQYPTKEMIKRSILVEMESNYGKGVCFDVLFDRETMQVVFNHFGDFEDEYPALSQSDLSREDAMKQAAYTYIK